MKSSLPILLCCLISVLSHGQNVSTDSVSSFSVLDATTDKIDSLQRRFYQKSDSIRQAYKSKFARLDSARATLRDKLDKLASIQAPQGTTLSKDKPDSIKTALRGRADSLSAATTRRLSHSLDSINTLLDSAIVQLNQKIQSLKNKTVGQLKSLNVPVQSSDKISAATAKVEGFQITAADLNLPSVELNNGIGTGQIGNLDFPALPDKMRAGQLPNVDTNIASIPDLTDKLGAYNNDLKALGSGNFGEMKELPKAAEARAEELSGLNEIKNQTQPFEEYKQQATVIQDPDSLKGFVVQEVRQVAVNHFAGKEQQLKEAMETVSKYKSKYSSLNSISEITKRPPNEMRGRPLMERIVPGIGLQIQKRGGDLMVDFNPYAGYRFTGRITAGLGWNQRIAFNIDGGRFNPEAGIYGPRAFGEFKLWKGFSPRAELELMNTTIPPTTIATTNPDVSDREWVWGAFIGMKKEYRLIKSIKGTAMVMMRLFDPDHKSPYADIVNVRLGFEFPQKPKAGKPN